MTFNRGLLGMVLALPLAAAVATGANAQEYGYYADSDGYSYSEYYSERSRDNSAVAAALGFLGGVTVGAVAASSQPRYVEPHYVVVHEEPSCVKVWRKVWIDKYYGYERRKVLVCN